MNHRSKGLDESYIKLCAGIAERIQKIMQPNKQQKPVLTATTTTIDTSLIKKEVNENNKGRDMYITELIGKEVLDKNAAAIGKVTDVNIDFPGWKVIYITVKMGVFNKFSISIEKIDKIAAKVTLNVAKDELIPVVV